MTGDLKGAWDEYSAWVTGHNDEELRANQRVSSPAPEVVAFLKLCSARKLLHLFCGTGDELRYLARAVPLSSGLGVDWSAAFIDFANREPVSGIEYICANVFEFLAQCDPQAVEFVLTTYGSLWWVDGLDDYLSSVRRVLAAGGFYIISEFHPLLVGMNYRGEPEDFAVPESTRVDWPRGLRDYRNLSGSFQGTRPVAYFRHPIGTIVNSGLRHGLHVHSLSEFPWVHGEQPFENMVQRGARFEFERPVLPLSYLLVLRKM